MLGLTKILCSLLFILFPQIILSQVTATVLDSLSKNPIPYANIWVENQDTNTITNLEGLFSLPTIPKNELLVISAVGYVTKKVKVSSILDRVQLSPQFFELDEVVVTSASKKRKKTKLVQKIQRSKLGHYLPGFKSFKYRRVFAKYFTYQEEYNKTPYLCEIRITTKSSIDSAAFNIILFAVNEKGEPDGYIYPEKISAIAKKGRQNTKIELSDLNIVFPKEGFFIAVEWLPILKNDSVWESIHPEVGFMQLNSDRDSWYYKQGRWQKIWKNGGPYKHYKDKYNHLALELVISN